MSAKLIATSYSIASCQPGPKQICVVGLSVRTWTGSLVAMRLRFEVASRFRA